MKMTINGVSVDRSKKFKIINPADDSVIDTVPLASLQDARKAISAADSARKTLKSM